MHGLMHLVNHGMQVTLPSHVARTSRAGQALQVKVLLCQPRAHITSRCEHQPVGFCSSHWQGEQSFASHQSLSFSLSAVGREREWQEAFCGNEDPRLLIIEERPTDEQTVATKGKTREKGISGTILVVMHNAKQHNLCAPAPHHHSNRNIAENVIVIS